MEQINIAPGPSRPLLTLAVVFLGNLVFGAGFYAGRHSAPLRAVPRPAPVYQTVAPPPPVVVMPPAPAPSCTYPAAPRRACPADAMIARIGNNRYLVRRELIDCVLEAPGELAASARIVPSFVDGRANGFRVYALRPDGLFARLGLLNGDRITHVNGMELSTPDRCLEAYSKVRAAERVTVDIERRGAKLQLAYVITKPPAR